LRADELHGVALKRAWDDKRRTRECRRERCIANNETTTRQQMRRACIARATMGPAARSARSRRADWMTKPSRRLSPSRRMIQCRSIRAQRKSRTPMLTPICPGTLPLTQNRPEIGELLIARNNRAFLPAQGAHYASCIRSAESKG